MALFSKDREIQRRRAPLLASVAFIASLFTGNAFAQQQGSNDRPQREWDPVLSANIEAQREQEYREREEEEAAGPEGSPGRRALEARRRVEYCEGTQKIIRENGGVGVITRQALEANCPPEVTARVLRENRR